jgi:hypothetical protein
MLWSVGFITRDPRNLAGVTYFNQFSVNPFFAPPPPKRNVFISSFHADRAEVDAFIYRWATLEKVFTAKALCTFDNDDFINSTNPEYVMGEIRRKYIGDASVTIVLIGKCTHSRRYIDWEIKASLRRGQSLPNGLLAYILPSAMPPAFGLYGSPLEWTQRGWPRIPERLATNWNCVHQQHCYARYYTMPDSGGVLRQTIEHAFWDRTNRASLIKNESEMMKYNIQCGACGISH